MVIKGSPARWPSGNLSTRRRHFIAELRGADDQADDSELERASLFQSSGPAAGDVLDHEVTIAAEVFLPTHSPEYSTGEIRPVEGTQFDFRQATLLGARIMQPDPQIFLWPGL